jgi:hypothetical protein
MRAIKDWAEANMSQVWMARDRYDAAAKEQVA